jgi:hypothetical protein
MSTFTNIIFNGPILEMQIRTIDELVEMLEKEPLSSQWDVGDGFIHQHKTIPSLTVISGRFETSQYRFRVETNDSSIIEKLSAEIQANRDTRAYKEFRTLRFSYAFKTALVKQIEAGENSEAVLFLKHKYKVSGRPESFDSIYKRFDWEEGKWIAAEDLLHCTLDLGFDLVLTEEDKFPRD